MEDNTTTVATNSSLFGNLASMEIRHTVDYGRMTMLIMIALASWFGFSLILKLISAALYKKA